MGWKLSQDPERSARLDRLTEADIITPELFDNILDRHSQPDEEKEDKGILERLIVATGITDVNSNITSKNFRITEEPDDRELVLAHPNELATTEEVHAFMAEQGIQPEGPEYLARYAKENPKAGLDYPVVALDPDKLWQDPNGFLVCVVLWSYDGVRYFDLLWIDDHWDGRCRFLGSRKLKP